MRQANFAYAEPVAEVLACVAAIYSARAGTAANLRADAAAAGFGVVEYDLLAELASNAPVLAADVMLVDCPDDDGATLAALMQLDVKAAQARIPLIITTSMSALDGVFACLDQSGAEVLVDATTGERVLALARAATRVRPMGVRERDEADRVALLRLIEQVARIAAQIDRLAGEPRAFRLESPGKPFANQNDAARPLAPSTASLPDPRLVRRIIRQRQLRAQFFDADLFAEPAWDILLDLTAAQAEHTRVSVTSLCIASGVPPTTALRWIGQMTEAGLLERTEDETDRRRAFIRLSDKAADAMARYFAELGKDGTSLI